MTTSHYIQYDAPRLGGGMQRAICGAKVDGTSHRNEPDCPDCVAQLAEDEATSRLLTDIYAETPSTETPDGDDEDDVDDSDIDDDADDPTRDELERIEAEIEKERLD
jgi:hypothetical protein